MPMNIKNRLKKLENEVINDEAFCACYPQLFETYIQDLTADAKNNAPVLKSEPTPNACLYCRKPIEKNSIIVQIVDAATKDCFPEE